MIPALQQAHARLVRAKKLKHRPEDHIDGPCAACDEWSTALAALLALDTSAGETPQGATLNRRYQRPDVSVEPDTYDSPAPPETPTIRPSAPQEPPQLMRRNMSKLLDKLYGLHYRPGHLDSVMDVVQAFAAPAVASAPPHGWQPIETAPKDVGLLQGWWPDRYNCAVPIWWDTDHWCGEGDERDSDSQPTHWMPLPAPPVSDREETDR